MPTNLPASVTRVIDGDTLVAHIEKVVDVVTTKSNYNKPVTIDLMELLGLAIDISVVKGKATVKVRMDKHIRVNGIDAYEHTLIPQGPQAVALAKSLLDGKTVTLNLLKPDKYGRALADVTLPDNSDYKQHLIDAKLGVPYFGGTKTLPQPAPNTTGAIVKVS